MNTVWSFFTVRRRRQDFKNRNDLAHALMVRYLEEDDRILTALFEQAAALVDDPYQRLIEGGIVLSRLEGSNEVLARQILLFRDYVRRVFHPREAS